jgi:hypothetical protein
LVHRVLAVALAGVVFLAGCASAPSGRYAFTETAPETTCFPPVDEAAPPSWVSRVSGGIAGVALGALWGASEGLSLAFHSGGSNSRSAWIGAAAGAGVGLVVGLVSGAVEGGRNGSPWHKPAEESCAAPDTAAKATPAKSKPAKATLVQAEKDASEAD